jgi:four helix bundle protein
MGERMKAPDLFEDLEAWQMARGLANEVYRLCRRKPLCRDFGLTDQLRRAAVSAMNNLAEGLDRIHLAEKSRLMVTHAVHAVSFAP